MAEEKPFEATTSRLARARREGDLPRSQDLVAVVSLACGVLAAPAALNGIAGAARRALAEAARADGVSGAPYVALAGWTAAVPLAALTGSLLISYLQAGSFSVKFPALKFERLSPAAGVKRMFSRDALAGGGKAVVVAAAVSCAVVPALEAAFAAGSGGFGPAALAALVLGAFGRLLAGALLVAAAFAAGDVLLERTKWKRRLKMSFAELKRDHRQSEGDPLAKGRRRHTHRALVRGSIGRLKEAAFVVTNPTHVAIALQYEPPAVPVPRVVVRAVDAGAREVKRRARDLRIPIIENVALARSLLASTAVGDYIPAHAYVAVAAIVASLQARPELAARGAAAGE